MVKGILLILLKRYPIHTAFSEQVIPLIKFFLIQQPCLVIQKLAEGLKWDF